MNSQGFKVGRGWFDPSPVAYAALGFILGLLAAGAVTAALIVLAIFAVLGALEYVGVAYGKWR